MADTNDMELLRDYSGTGSEAAFAEVVRRHIGLVYSVALRHVGIAAQAEEITQAVFIILARKASGIRPDTVLEGWLYETTRLTALSFQRGERRRQFREQEAYMQSTLQESNDTTVWNQLSPLLDEGMARLGKKDRDAVVLRFFREKNMSEVATAMQVNEAAAQRRIHRAVEKLRSFFTKRGVTLPAAVLTAAISANSVKAAPLGLAKAATTVAVAKGAMAGSSTLMLVKGALNLMAWTRAKTAMMMAGSALAAGTVTGLLLLENSSTAAANPGLKQPATPPAATPLDLTAKYDLPLVRFDEIVAVPAWKTVPRGTQTFAGVPLQIGGAICLWGEGNATRLNDIFPEQIVGIAVKQKFETLYVYHGAFFKSADGTPVCRIVFRYQDGSSVTNEMLYGDDILDWIAKGEPVVGPAGPNSMLAWVGGSFSTNRDEPLRFCLTAIDNPQPTNEVETIDLYSAKSWTAVCIMAMTTGKSGLMH